MSATVPDIVRNPTPNAGPPTRPDRVLVATAPPENYFFTDTGHSNSVRKKSTYLKSQKIHVLDKKISTSHWQMAKWHTNLKRQKHFDKNNLSHNRAHFSLKILQKTSDFHIFMEACWTLDCRKGPETKIFHPGLVNLPSNFRKMAAFNLNDSCPAPGDYATGYISQATVTIFNVVKIVSQ